MTRRSRDPPPPLGELRPLRTGLAPPRPPLAAAGSSGARMRRAVHRGEALSTHVRVNLSRAEARVPQYLLHRTQIGTAVEQVRRRRVPQRVRARWPRAWQFGEQTGDEAVHGAGREATTAGAQQQRRRVASQCGSTALEIGPKRPLRGQPERHDALFRPLAQHTHDAPLVIDVVDVEPHELAHTQGARVEQLDRHAVTQSARGITRGAGVEIVIQAWVSVTSAATAPSAI